MQSLHLNSSINSKQTSDILKGFNVLMNVTNLIICRKVVPVVTSEKQKVKLVIEKINPEINVKK